MTSALATLAEPGGGENANAQKLPPKPYTVYTIFFRLERAYLLQSAGVVDEEVVPSLDPSHFDPVEHPRPARYARLALPPYWYCSSHKAAIEKKRKHRKRAGRMDLKTLSKTISARWREADPDIVDYCRKLAKAEKENYEKRIEGIVNMKNEIQDDKATNADTGAEASSGVEQQQGQQQALLLPKEKPAEVASAPFVLPQAKQQAGNSVTAHRQSNKAAPNSNSALSLQDFVFLKPKQAEKVAPEFASIGTLSLQDFVFSKPKQATNATVPMSMPAAAAPITVSNNIKRLKDSFNEVMGYSSNGLQTNQESEAVLQVLQHQDAQHQKMNICGAVSPSSSDHTRPHAFLGEGGPRGKKRPSLGQGPHLDARNLQELRGLRRAGVANAQRRKSPAPFANARDLGGVRPANRPAKKNKREFLRRASAPPEFVTVPARPRAIANDDVVVCRAVGGGDTDSFAGEDDPKGMKRRSSMIDLNGRGPLLDTARGLSDCFEKGPDGEGFSHVPKWEKEDADELLDLLNVPQAAEPAVGDDRASEFTADQEVKLFMNDIGMGDDSYYCKVI